MNPYEITEIKDRKISTGGKYEIIIHSDSML